jgi:hypothetical protein
MSWYTAFIFNKNINQIYELRVYWWKDRKIVLINYDFSRRDREAIKERMKERN